MALIAGLGRRRGPASLEVQIVLHHAGDKMSFLHGSYELAPEPRSKPVRTRMTGACHWREPPEMS
jgi:hypothetical protein